MKIIGHRGAAGMALENSIEAIKHAIEAGVDAIELDTRLTADGVFVLSHDPTTKRVSPQMLGIHEETIGVLSQVIMHNGEHIPTLQAAVKAAGKTSLVIEVKGTNWAKSLVRFLKPHRGKDITVIAMDHEELALFHTLLPEVNAYAVQKFHHASEVFETFRFAQSIGLEGIDMNFWLLNPLTYWLAKRHKLKVIVYTVNHAWIARFLIRLFPGIAITTNYPNRMQFLRVK